MDRKHFWLVFLVCFGTLWLIPLLLPSGSLERYAWEELRVIAVGFLLGVLFVTMRQRGKVI